MDIFLLAKISKKKILHYHELFMLMKITVVYFRHAAFSSNIPRKSLGLFL